MIPVEFTLEPKESAFDFLDYWQHRMPWLQYLNEKKKHVFVTSRYEPAPHLNVVTFKFYLNPNDELIYKLKFSG